MKKLMALALALALIFGGCTWNICDRISAEQLAKAESTLKGIQVFYGPLQALVPLIPVGGPVLAVAIPAALSSADLALNSLGEMIATKCVNGQQLTLAQVAFEAIQKLFADPQVKAVMAKYKVRAP